MFHHDSNLPSHRLPPRPAFQPSLGSSRQFASQTQHAYQPDYQPQPHDQPQSSHYLSQTPVYLYHDASGGYPEYPQQSYPYFPTQTYAQSMFPSRPAATPEGYSYSSTYLQHPESSFAPAPSKGRRLEVPGSLTGGGRKAWRNCCQPGCKFVGPGEEVEVHEGDRHLIFPKGKQVQLSEEEEKSAKHNG